MVSARLAPFGTTVFSEMTRIAEEHGAINLSQGFPDFDGPDILFEAAQEALRTGSNQYARSQGTWPLVRAVAAQRQQLYGLRYDPVSEVAVYSGATEGLASALLGILDPGDRIILFEPVYDSYPACVAMADAVADYVPLQFPKFTLDLDAVAAKIQSKTRAILINTPHNPTGRVFSREELEGLASLATRHNLVVITDEVYEHLYYGDQPHIPIATLDGMRDRTLSICSLGKTFAVTGWKIGWGTGPKHLVSAAQSAHQFLTFATATPLQLAAARALSELPSGYYDGLRDDYRARRDVLVDTLVEVGLRPAVPEGSCFVLSEFDKVFAGDDVQFARHMVREVGVAVIPPSFFYPAHPEEGRTLARFAFCKRMDTLEAARKRILNSFEGSPD